MSEQLKQVLAANAAYAESFGDKADLPVPPRRRFAILTCMDSRLDPARFAGLAEGDAHVIRNAGGRATDDAIQALVISHKMLGTLEWFVIHHSECGMSLVTDQIIGDLLAGSLKTASHTPDKGWHNTDAGPGSPLGRELKWHTYTTLEQSLTEDVRRIREHPLVPRDIPIYGYWYDVRSGKLVELPQATQLGKALA